VEQPETRYAKSADGVHIAYQVAGDGPVDLMLAGIGSYSNIEFVWQLPGVTRYLGAWHRSHGSSSSTQGAWVCPIH